MCPCKKKTMENQVPPPIVSAPEHSVKSNPSPARTGVCPYCLRKHLLKAAGYAKEVREELGRTWEEERLLENLLLAEDHAEALGDWGFRAAIRVARLQVEDGGTPDIEPLLARAREKILESQRGAGVENKSEPARTEEH